MNLPSKDKPSKLKLSPLGESLGPNSSRAKKPSAYCVEKRGESIYGVVSRYSREAGCGSLSCGPHHVVTMAWEGQVLATIYRIPGALGE